MKTGSMSARTCALVCSLAALLLMAPMVHAQTFNVVYNFTGGSDGGDSTAGMVYDSGLFYGTTTQGGTSGNGVVFKIEPSGQESVLYSFTGGADGGTPESGLLFYNGYLYGTASAGGADGSGPQGSLVRDSKGNLYGTTFSGGASGNGTVFELLRPAVKGNPWTEQVLYSFGTGTDGANPVGGVSFDKAGNLYGTTSAGGTDAYGTVFQLAKSDSGWTENILYQFQMLNDGGVPYAGIVLDTFDNLYGAATAGGLGGDNNGGGTIFEITPSGGSWSFTSLYSLPGWGISGTFRNILLRNGDIYATTHCDGNNNAGTVYELSKSSGTWNYAQLYSFTGSSDGLYSVSTPVFDKDGNLWATTRYGGTNNQGVVFEIKP
jgi:uncharacterized repeat protein (TIGR03803 family)